MKHGKPGGAEVEKPGSRKAERQHPRSRCEARRGRAERKRQRLSSRKRKGSGRKKADRKRKMPEARAEGKHLWNGCGSEVGKGKRKRTAKPSTGTLKEGMRNQAGEKGETEEARAESGTGEAAARRNREEKERKSRGRVVRIQN